MVFARSTNSEGNPIVNLRAYDLIPDHPLSAVFASLFVLLGSLFEVATELVVAALVLFILNCLMSFLWSYRIKGKLNGELGATLGYRLMAYIIGLGGVIVFSNMAIPDFVGERLRETAFQAVAGIEFVVSLGLLARVVPLFRPIYAGLLEWTDSLIPIADFGVGDIEGAIHSYPGHAARKEEPEDESTDATP